MWTDLNVQDGKTGVLQIRDVVPLTVASVVDLVEVNREAVTALYSVHLTSMVCPLCDFGHMDISTSLVDAHTTS